MTLLILLYLLAPVGVIWLCNRFTFLGKVGPVLILYILGVIVGNMPFLPAGAAEMQMNLSSAIIPVAIPMLLFNADFKSISLKNSFKTLFAGVVAVLVTIVIGFLLFRKPIGAEAAQVGGLLTGVYIGGTANMAALKLMLNVREETYILLNSYDMIISFLYMVFLFTAGIRMFRWLLPVRENGRITKTSAQYVAMDVLEASGFRHFFTRKAVVQVAAALGLSLVIVAASFGVSQLFSEKFFMIVMILSLTTLGIAASFFAPVRKLEKSYDAGMYLVYIFSIVVASLARLSELDLQGGLYMLYYITFAIFVSLTIQALLSRVMGVDGDSMVICSVALINSAPFVPTMAAAMRNRSVIVMGISIGLVGYALGNYLGYLMYELLNIL